MTDHDDDRIPGADYALDAVGYLNQYGSHLDHAPTKEQHDRRVAETGRNYTDTGIVRRHTAGGSNLSDRSEDNR